MFSSECNVFVWTARVTALLSLLLYPYCLPRPFVTYPGALRLGLSIKNVFHKRYRAPKGKRGAKKSGKELNNHHGFSQSQKSLNIFYQMGLILPTAEVGGNLTWEGHVNCLGYRRSSVNVSFLSFPGDSRCFITCLPCNSTSLIWRSW